MTEDRGGAEEAPRRGELVPAAAAASMREWAEELSLRPEPTGSR
jgi:hypothetical protein